ncbi:MAG: hypothetical protein EOO89_11060 [Pedobacter sp.]|nr:MAG: hypothetical protein EOO89_11060 [Pedobacter sp.]
MLYPYAILKDANGNSLPTTFGLRNAYIDTAGKGKLLDWHYYPLEDYKYRKNTNVLNALVLNTGLKYGLTQGLSIELLYQFQKQSSVQSNLDLQESYFTRNSINRFTQLIGGIPVYKLPIGDIQNNYYNNTKAHNLRGQVNYSRKFGMHNLSGMIGSEVREVITTGDESLIYGFDESKLTTSLVDYANSYPTYVTGSKSYIPNTSDPIYKTNRVISLYGNAGYTLLDKYTLILSARKDASNLFGVSVNDKWNLLWSAGAGWELSKENFYSSKLFPYIKLRGSFGLSGNIDPTMAAVTTFVNNGVLPLSGFTISNINNYSNPELSWETVEMLNIGVDFRIGNRIEGSADVFNKSTYGLLASTPLDYTTGINSITKNVASTTGTGLDLSLNSQNITGKFKWSTTLNFSVYKDKIKEYYLSSLQGSRFVLNSAPAVTGLIGYPIYGAYSYKWAGLDPLTGDPQGYLKGEVSKNYSALTGSTVTFNDLVYHGRVIAPFYGSLSNTLGYLNWSATVNISYKLGHFFRKQSINYASLYNSMNGHADYTKRWKKPGDEAFTNVPSSTYPAVTARESFYSNSEVLIEKADHIRLQYVTVNYSLGERAIKKLPFKTIVVSDEDAELLAIVKERLAKPQKGIKVSLDDL